MERYQVLWRRQSWQVVTLTMRGGYKTIRRFSNQEDAMFWAKVANERANDNQEGGQDGRRNENG